MAVITSGAHPKAVWPGVHAWFGAKYASHGDQTTKLFETKTSNKKYEEIVETTGFGVAPVKAEGSSVAYDAHAQGITSRGTNVAYALGYIVTKEEKDDNLYEEVSMQRAESLAFSMATTRNIVGANVYNRAFTAAYAGGDGKELLSDAHPSLAGNMSNELATAADMSEASLEDLTIQIMDAKNSKGLQIALQPKCLIVPTALVYEARRILSSLLRSGTADNDLNALNSLNAIPEVVVNNYLTDSDAWFLTTDVPNGMKHFVRTAMTTGMDGDFDTGNTRYKARERYSFGVSDPLGIFGSPGV